MKALKILWLVIPLAFLLLVSSCDMTTDIQTQKPFYSEIQLWAHYGNEGERRIFQEQVNYFNEHHDLVRINAVILPTEAYHDKINKAVIEHTLPDILAVNSNYVALYADQKSIVPMDKFLTDNTRNDLLVPVLKQGVFNGRLYMISPSTSGLVLYANKEKLLVAGDAAFIQNSKHLTMDEFDSLLKRLAAQDDDGAVMDMGALTRHEWAGQMLVSQFRNSSEQTITVDDSVSYSGIKNALQHISEWVKHGYVDGDEGNALLNGDVALSWSLLSDYPKLRQAMGDNLIMIPFPDFFGHASSETGPSHVDSSHSLHSIMNGWGWSITRECNDIQAAMRFLEYIFQKQTVIEASNESKLMPATISALQDMNYFSSLQQIDFINYDDSEALPRKPLLYPEVYSIVQNAYVKVSRGQVVDTVFSQL